MSFVGRFVLFRSVLYRRFHYTDMDLASSDPDLEWKLCLCTHGMYNVATVDPHYSGTPL